MIDTAASLSAIAARVYGERAQAMGVEPEAEHDKRGAVGWPDAGAIYQRRAAAMAPKAKPAA